MECIYFSTVSHFPNYFFSEGKFQDIRMGNAASIQPDQFLILKAEYEAKKDTLSDEELFNYMKTIHDGLIASSQATTTTTAAASTSEAAHVATS